MTVTEHTDQDVSPYLADAPPGFAQPEGDSPTKPEGAELAATGSSGDRLTAGRYLTRAALVALATVAVSVVVQLVLVSGLQHRVNQRRAFDRFRKVLAEGTAPVSQVDSAGHLLALGTPVALITIPAIHVHEIVAEGTTGGILMSGPGHRRDTPMPGQAGTSVIMGREAAYGGPFKRLSHLRPGAHIVVITGQGTSTFEVIGLRRGGDPAPPPLSSDKGRLTLITARGTPFVPAGVLRVDADLATPTLATPPTVIPLNSAPHGEQAMGTDPSTLWTLALWLEALILLAVTGVWSWSRWGRRQTWIVFLPAIALVGFFVAGQGAKLLPNLL
jgi:sortase A